MDIYRSMEQTYLSALALDAQSEDNSGLKDSREGGPDHTRINNTYRYLELESWYEQLQESLERQSLNIEYASIRQNTLKEKPEGSDTFRRRSIGLGRVDEFFTLVYRPSLWTAWTILKASVGPRDPPGGEERESRRPAAVS